MSAAQTLGAVAPKDKNQARAALDQLFLALALGQPETDLIKAGLTAISRDGPGGAGFARFAVPEIDSAGNHQAPLLRAVAIAVTGGNMDPLTSLLAWLGRPSSAPLEIIRGNPVVAERVLKLLLEQWPPRESEPEAADEAEGIVAKIVGAACKSPLSVESWQDLAEAAKAWLVQLLSRGAVSQCWTPEGRQTLEKLRDKIQNESFKQTVASSLNADSLAPILSWASWSVVGWTILWAALIFVFPWSPLVQSAFFYNPQLRAYLSLGFVPLLLLIPFLRARLLSPFRRDLLAAARPDHFQDLGFFGESKATFGGGRETELAALLPRLEGNVLFRGEAGIGKTSALRYVAVHAKRPVAFLHASACADGVDAAIARILRDVQEKSFVKGLVYSRSMQVIIDGLNEVGAETRERIATFAREMSKSDIFIGTQPIDWKLDSAKILTLEPLDRAASEKFLLSRPVAKDPKQVRHGKAFEEAARKFLRRALDKPRSQEDRRAAREMLSNPFDLAFAADLLARGATPSPVRLIDEAFRLADAEYREELGRPFPLLPFAKLAVAMRLEDRNWLKDDEFASETKYLLRWKLLMPRSALELQGEKQVEKQRLLFRHDRVWDFFLAAAFEGDPDLWERHGGDPRFRGALLRISESWAPKKAKELFDVLAVIGAKTRDHTTSDEFLLRLTPRLPPREAKPPEPPQADAALAPADDLEPSQG
jgi:hypothetical protein